MAWLLPLVAFGLYFFVEDKEVLFRYLVFATIAVPVIVLVARAWHYNDDPLPYSVACSLVVFSYSGAVFTLVIMVILAILLIVSAGFEQRRRLHAVGACAIYLFGLGAMYILGSALFTADLPVVAIYTLLAMLVPVLINFLDYKHGRYVVLARLRKHTT